MSTSINHEVRTAAELLPAWEDAKGWQHILWGSSLTLFHRSTGTRHKRDVINHNGQLFGPTCRFEVLDPSATWNAKLPPVCELNSSLLCTDSIFKAVNNSGNRALIFFFTWPQGYAWPSGRKFCSVHPHLKNTNKPSVRCIVYYEEVIVILSWNGKMKIWETRASAVVLAVVGLSLARSTVHDWHKEVFKGTRERKHCIFHIWFDLP